MTVTFIRNEWNYNLDDILSAVPNPRKYPRGRIFGTTVRNGREYIAYLTSFNNLVYVEKR